VRRRRSRGMPSRGVSALEVGRPGRGATCTLKGALLSFARIAWAPFSGPNFLRKHRLRLIQRLCVPGTTCGKSAPPVAGHCMTCDQSKVSSEISWSLQTRPSRLAGLFLPRCPEPLPATGTDPTTNTDAIPRLARFYTRRQDELTARAVPQLT
jgi:hypothetical protein